jgi:hypothetical protein
VILSAGDKISEAILSPAIRRIRALEQAMIMSSRWTGRDFQRLLVRHL